MTEREPGSDRPTDHASAILDVHGLRRGKRQAERRVPHLAGIVPANLTPFKEDFSIDADELQRLVDRLVSVEGVGAIFCNGHAGEVAALSREERKLVVRLVAEAVNGRVPVISGVYTDSTEEAVGMALDAKKAGASIATLFPPPIFADGATESSDMPFQLFKTVATRANLPLVVFQFPRSTGLGYTTETLARLAELPEVVGVKEGSSDMRVYERNLRALSNANPPVPVLTSNNTWLMASLAVGGDGILSGGSNVVASQHVELWQAMASGDLQRAQACHDRLYPLVEALYRSPWIDIHTRMKEALVMMGLLKRAVARPPLIPLGQEEKGRIRLALEAAKLL